MAQGETEILQSGFKPKREDVLTLFAEMEIVAKFAASGVVRVVGRGAGGLQILRFLIAVPGHFFFQFLIEFLAAKEQRKPFEKSEFHFLFLGVLHDAGDSGNHLFKVRAFGGELLATGGGEGVVAGATVGVRPAPFGFDPALQEEALEGGVQRAFFDGEDFVGQSFDGERDAVAVERSARERF